MAKFNFTVDVSSENPNYTFSVSNTGYDTLEEAVNTMGQSLKQKLVEKKAPSGIYYIHTLFTQTVNSVDEYVDSDEGSIAWSYERCQIDVQ